MNREESLLDREELILRAALIYEKMSELAQQPNRDRAEWQKTQAATKNLEEKWRLLMRQIEGLEYE